MAPIEDTLVFCVTSFLGNVGIASTGNGMAIIFFLVYQIIAISGYAENFKYAIFIQALALFISMPLLIKKAEVKKYGSWKVLQYFIPVTIVSTPLGLFLGQCVSTIMVKRFAGFPIMFVAVVEIYQNREQFVKKIRKYCFLRNSVKNIKNQKNSMDITVRIEQEYDEEHCASLKQPKAIIVIQSKNSAEDKAGSSNDDELISEQRETANKASDLIDTCELVDKLEDNSSCAIKDNRKKINSQRQNATPIIDKIAILKEGGGMMTKETSMAFSTLLAGATSGFLGGLCGISGPPMILYFLHPPQLVRFNKKTQRATATTLEAISVFIRVSYYLIETYALDRENFFDSSDWFLYVCVVISSLGGVFTGNMMFDYMKDSRDNIEMILTILLVFCGTSLLLSSFFQHIQ